MEEGGELAHSDPSSFWVYLEGIKDAAGKPRFPTVSKFMQTLMCLPHSSASAERKFSQLKLIKTPLRNRISPSTVSSLMHAHRLVRSRGGAVKWKIPTTLAKAARQRKC